jgi:ATP-binding cassette subfamily F protein 3
MVKVSDVGMSFGGQVVFENVKFNVNRGERIGLIGRNGSGKTTLLNLISGALKLETGSISIPRGYRIGHLSQRLSFGQNSVLVEGCAALPRESADETWRVEKVLGGLGFTETDLARPPDELSGGFQVRLNLAKVLIEGPDLLLLDEPNNFLDVLSIRWLIDTLRSWRGEIMLITHDRGFMDAVVTHTMIIHRQSIRKLRGGTEKLYEQILKEEEILEKTRVNIEKKQKETEEFITRFRAKARLAGLVQSRIKLVEKRRAPEKLEKLKNIEFSFTASPSPSRYMLNARSISFSYGGTAPLLFDGFSIHVARGDRIGVIGKNGTGKTTLIRVLAGELAPLSGGVSRHPELRMGYFGQTNVERLNESRTIEQELLDSDPDYSRKKVMDICGAMNFGGELAGKKISVLSGGERSRVLLGKLLLTPANLLLLDEPTNHLDMESCDSLLAAVDSFAGAVVIVTHNETFLRTLARKLIVFDRGKTFVHGEGYDDFLRRYGWESEKTEAAEGERQPGGPSRNDIRRHRASVVAEKSRTLKPIQDRITDIEASIQSAERQLDDLNDRIILASQNGDGEAIARLSKQSHSLAARVTALYDELEEFLEKQEEGEREFRKKLDGLART